MKQKNISGTTSFSIDPKLLEILDRASRVTGRSKGEIINEALREQLTGVIDELLELQDSMRVELEKDLGEMRSEKRTRGGSGKK